MPSSNGAVSVFSRAAEHPHRSLSRPVWKAPNCLRPESRRLSLKLTFVCPGTRGDVQPFVALALGLQRAGHQVVLATHEIHRWLVESQGLSYAPLAGNPQALLESAEGRKLLHAGDNSLKSARGLARLAQSLATEMLWDAAAAADGADFALGSFTSIHLCETLHEAVGLRPIYTSLQPLAPTGTTFGMAGVQIPRWLEGPIARWLRFQGQTLGLKMFSSLFADEANKARKAVFDLPPRTQWLNAAFFQTQQPFIYGLSEQIFPRPSDWAPSQQLAGYWFLDQAAGWEPPSDLLEFLASGSPPVYLGFGSMPDEDQASFLATARSALRQVGRRGVLFTGWTQGQKPTSTPELFIGHHAPHDWLFPRMAAVVHHGGAGTTAAGLRAGVPSVIVPFMGDQPYWAHRVRTVGAGVGPLPRRNLTAATFARALTQALSDPICQRAAELGEKIRSENGVQRGVELIEQAAVEWNARRPARFKC
jgi:sterol 3beta-glucosyltransferase